MVTLVCMMSTVLYFITLTSAENTAAIGKRSIVMSVSVSVHEPDESITKGVPGAKPAKHHLPCS